uniref:Putative tritil protein n=1 Tax=Rhipicephalus pulchellus TaxID=72859 RepID=L7LR86_RHIPC
MGGRMHCVAFLVFLAVAVVESVPLNCTNCGNLKCGENEVFVAGNGRQDEFCKPFFTPLSVLKRPRQCVCKPHFVRNSWGECVSKKNCLRCKSRLQKDWHLCSSSCPVTGNKAIRFLCRTMCTPGCDCPPGWVVDPNNWKKCIKAESSPPLCQPNSRFQPCVSTCEPVCGLRPPKHCFTHCHRGACVCNKGFAALVRNGELICVRQEKCEWYLRTAPFITLNRTAIAGGEIVANNLNSVISRNGGVVLSNAFGHAISSEGTYSGGTSPNDNMTIGLHGTAINSATTPSGSAIRLGSTDTGIGRAGILSSAAAGLGGNEARLGGMISSISARPGMVAVRTSGEPSIVPPRPGTGMEDVGSALPSVSMGSTINHGGFSTGAHTRAHIRTGPVNTSTGAAANTSSGHTAATGMTVSGSGIAGMVGAGIHPNVDADEAIAANSGAGTTATAVPSFPSGGLGAIRAGIRSFPGSVTTEGSLSNTGAAGAEPGVDGGSLVHGMTSVTGSAVGLLSNTGLRHDAITVATGTVVPASMSHGRIAVGAGNAPTVMSSPRRGGGTVLSGTHELPSSSVGGIDAGGERAGARSNVLIGTGAVNFGPSGPSATGSLASSRAQVDRIIAGIAGTHGSRSSDSYRIASLSTLPDGIYSSARGTAMIPSFPAGSRGVLVSSLTRVSPPHVPATTSEIATELSAGGGSYAGRVGETDRIAVGNDRLPAAGGPNAQAPGTHSAGVNGGNVPTGASLPPFSPFGAASRGQDGVVSTPGLLPASTYTLGSGTIMTTESSGGSAGSGRVLLPVTTGADGGVTTHSGDASLVVVTEAGGHDGFGGADGRHTSASSEHRWTYTNTLGDVLNINRDHTSSSAGNNRRFSTSTVAVGNRMGSSGRVGTANSTHEISVGGTRGTMNTRTTYTSETAGISRAGVGIEAANNRLVGIHTRLGTLPGTSHAGTVSPSTSTDRRQILATYTTGVVPAARVQLAPAATSAHTGAEGAAVGSGDVTEHRLNVAGISRAKYVETFNNLYPFILSFVHSPNTLESTSGLLTSNRASVSSLPKPTVPSRSIDGGESQPNAARVIDGASTPMSGTRLLVNK